MITKRVEEYCRNAGLTVSKFEKLCGIGNGAIRKWQKNRSSPSIATLSKIEKTTGIPIYMWIEEDLP